MVGGLLGPSDRSFRSLFVSIPDHTVQFVHNLVNLIVGKSFFPCRFLQRTPQRFTAGKAFDSLIHEITNGFRKHGDEVFDKRCAPDHRIGFPGVIVIVKLLMHTLLVGEFACGLSS